MDVGRKITELRTTQGISLTNLAKRSGIAQSSLSYIESGKTQPTVETVEKICTALGITLSEFFSDTQEQEPLPPEVRQIYKKVKRLPPDKLKVLNAVLDTWERD
ncbi:MAG: helix-turn-helix domain-containing protein [Firmicutes bacterium]|nr:helix-turn-helix domain-containing protein [Bacillota bacterium]